MSSTYLCRLPEVILIPWSLVICAIIERGKVEPELEFRLERAARSTH